MSDESSATPKTKPTASASYEQSASIAKNSAAQLKD